MSLSKLKILELYFYAPMAMSAVDRHCQALHALFAPVHGEDWHARLQACVDGYRACVERLLRERAETSMVIGQTHDLINRITLWRRSMEAVVRRAPAQEQKGLLRAAGWGLGSPRSIKASKEFLQQVKHLVALYAGRLTELGASEAHLQFARETLHSLEQASELAAQEKAQDSAARLEMQLRRQELTRLLDDLDLVAEIADTQSMLFADEASRLRSYAIKAELKSARNEACVQSYKRVQDKDVPAELLQSDGEARDAEAPPPVMPVGDNGAGEVVQP